MNEKQESNVERCMREYRDHGVPSFPIFIWLRLSNELHLFNVWFN